jgi:hypothetical protein
MGLGSGAGVRGLGRGSARSDYAWLIQLIDLLAHHPRWWIVAPRRYTSPRVMDPLVYHLDQPSDRANPIDRASVGPRAPTRGSNPARPRVGRLSCACAFYLSRSDPRALIEPTRLRSSRPMPWVPAPELSHFCYKWTQPFCCKRTQSFYFSELSHFCYICSIIFVICYSGSVILWYCQPFCYFGLSHFFRVLRSAIFYNTKSFLQSCQPFLQWLSS